jgi:hypothetical protein
MPSGVNQPIFGDDWLKNARAKSGSDSGSSAARVVAAQPASTGAGSRPLRSILLNSR